MYKIIFFTLLFTSFISNNIYAEENGTLTQVIHQFKKDASEFNVLLAIETKLEQQLQALQLQITSTETILAQLVRKQNRLDKKLDNDPSELDLEFLKLDEAVINSDLTNNRFKLNEYKNGLKNTSEQLTNLATNLNQLKRNQINKRKNIKLLITDKNTSLESVNRSISYPCETISLIEQCKSEAKKILLREISEKFSGLELQSITELENYLLIKDEVKTESKVTFSSVDITEQEMISVAGKNHLKLTLVAEFKKVLTAQDITLLHVKVDTALDKYLQESTQSFNGNINH